MNYYLLVRLLWTAKYKLAAAAVFCVLALIQERRDLSWT